MQQQNNHQKEVKIYINLKEFDQLLHYLLGTELLQKFINILKVKVKLIDVKAFENVLQE